MKYLSKKYSAIIFGIFLFSVLSQVTVLFSSVAYAQQKGYELLADIPTITIKENTPLPVYLQGIFIALVGLCVVFAVAMIVVGGIQYVLAAVPSSKENGKKRIMGAVGGLLLALLSYLLLQAINPELLNIGLNLDKTVFDPYTPTAPGQSSVTRPKNTVCVIEKDCSENCSYPSSASADPAGDCAKLQASYPSYPACNSGSDAKPCISRSCSSSSSATPKGCGGGNGKCQPLTSGPCSVSNLTQYFGGNADKASIICNAESGGVKTSESGSDRCRTGEPFSLGLFQINLTVHDLAGLSCAYTHKESPFTARNFSCTIRDTNFDMYAKCVNAAKTAAINIEYAVKLSKGGNNWSQWSTAKICGL
jgi:hypothetical protein